MFGKYMTESAASLSDNLTALLIPRVCSIAVANDGH